MRRTLKSSVALLGVLGLVGSLTACATNGQESTKGEEGGDLSGQTLEVWTRSDEAAAVNYEAVFAEFTDQTGIEVDYIPDPDLSTRLQTAAASGDLPDVVINNDAALGSYVSQGLLEKVDRELVDPDGTVRDEMWEESRGLDGDYYGVPYSRHVMATGIRTDWLEDLELDEPETLDDFISVATAFATEDPDGDGTDDTAGWSAALTSSSGYAAVWTAPFLWSYGGGLVTQTSSGDYEASASSPESVAGMEAALSVVCAVPSVLQPSAITDDTGDSAKLFYAGGAGMYSLGPWQFATLDDNLGSEAWGVIAPASGSEGTAALAEGENAYLMAGSDVAEAQTELAKFLIGETGQELGMTEGTVPSVRLSVNKNLDAGEVRDDDRWGTIQSIYDDAGRSFPAAIDFSAIRTAAGDALNAIYAECDDDPSSALKQLDAEISSILDEQASN